MPFWKPALAGAILAVAATASPARAHVVPVIDMQHGIVMTPAQCAALPMTVWVSAMGHSVCLRYYLSTAGGEGARPLVHLSGDKLGVLMGNGSWRTPDNMKDIETDTFLKIADRMSKQAKTTAIYLARIGIDGSSGDHRYRHTVLELQITSAALDAIKRRHKFDGFHLVGQSGGGTLIGGLLALRGDIGCAVPGSGDLADYKWAHSRRPPDRQILNPIEGVQMVARNNTARILVVTDPQDQQVPAAHQTPFVEALRKLGRPVDQFMVTATDDKHHGVTHYAHMVAAACIRGAATPEIAQDLQRLVERTLARKNAPKDMGRDSPRAEIATPRPMAEATAARRIADDRATYVVSP